MALWPNARYMTRSTYKGFGLDVGLAPINKGLGDRKNRFINASYESNASYPDGYGMNAFVPPIVAGSMSALRPILATDDGTTNLLQGGPMEGTATITFGQSGGLSLTVGLAGNTAVVTMTGNSMVLRLTVGLDGTGAFTLTGTNNLSMIVPFEGAGTVLTMGVGSTDLRGRLSMEGEWTPFTDLSPENLARAVWDALATQYNDTGTMGNKLNTASSGGVDLTALAAAVLAAAEANPIHANVKEVNSLTVDGTGTEADPWGPV